MILWGFYFITKIILNFAGTLRVDVWWNLAFALLLLVPTPERLARLPLFLKLRSLLHLAIAVALYWHDSWLPAFMDAVAMVKSQGLPEKEYIINFAMRYLDTQIVFGAVGLIILCAFLDRYFKLIPVSMLGLALIIPFNIYTQPDTTEVQGYVDGFYDYESTRLVNFKSLPDSKNPFDVIFLHVCSLSWDDLREVGLDQHSFFRQFQYLFTNFNGATAYSGPSMIRVMKMNCGQMPHTELYNRSSDECYVMNTLERAGFTTFAALNHNGQFGKFKEELQDYGRFTKPPFDTKNVAVKELMFDGSPVNSDYGVLEAWWSQRLASSAPAAALYYNTVSLHDGNRWIGQKDWFGKNQKALYYEFLHSMLDEMNRFLEKLKSSGRNVVVVFLPEHGYSLMGYTIQAAGLRDIPLPPITTLPVAVKLIGPAFAKQPLRQAEITKPTSYLAIATMLASFIEHNPFKNGTLPPNLVDELPITELASENMNAKVVKEGDHYYLYGKEKKWIALNFRRQATSQQQ